MKWDARFDKNKIDYNNRFIVKIFSLWMQNEKVNEKKLFREIMNIQDIPGHFEKT